MLSWTDAGEEQRLLGNDPDHRPEGRTVDLVDPHAVDEHRAPLRAAEAEQRPHEGALARARSADEGDELSRGDAEVDAFERRDGRRGISHGHALEPDLAGRAIHHHGSPRPGVDRLVEQPLDPPDGVAGALQIGPDSSRPDDRRGEPHRDEVECHELPEGDLLGNDELGSVPEDGGGEEPLHEVGRVGDPAREPVDSILHFREVPGGRLPAAVEAALDSERSNRLEVDDGLGHHELRTLHPRRSPPGPPAHGGQRGENDQCVERDPGDCDGGKPDVHEEQQGGEERGEDEIGNVGHRQTRDEGTDPLHLVEDRHHRLGRTRSDDRTIQEVPVHPFGERHPCAGRGAAEHVLAHGREEEPRTRPRAPPRSR